MLGSGEILIILCVVLLLFGGKKLPEFAKSLGQGIKEFKKACNQTDDYIQEQSPPSSSTKDEDVK